MYNISNLFIWRVFMTKLLFYTDLHLSAKIPRHRIDDYPRTLLNKLKEIYKLAKEEEVDCVLFGGDFFHSHRIYSYEIISEAIDIISSFSNKTYAVVGQHDLIGHNQETYKSSALAFLEGRCNKYETLWEPIEIGNVNISPCHWFDDFELMLKGRLSRKKTQIMVAHQTICKDNLPFDTFITSKLPKNEFNLVLSGDWHGGFDPHDNKGTKYCNPASIGRHAISDSEHIPQIALVTIDNSHKIDINLIKLDSLSAGEAFATTFLEEIRDKATMDTISFI